MPGIGEYSPEAYAADVANKRTRDIRLRNCRRYVDWADDRGIDILQARAVDVSAFIDELRPMYAASTCVTVQKSIRAYYHWLEERGFIERNPLEKLRDEQIPPKPIASVSPGDIRRLLDACTTDRNWAIIAIVAFNSVRIGELLECNVPDFQSRDGVHMLHISAGLRHSRRPEFVVLADEVASALRRYIGSRRTGPLFLSSRGVRLGRATASSGVFVQTSERAGLSYLARPEMVVNSMPVAALQHGYSYRGLVRAMGVPGRRYSERWLGMTDGPVEDNASIRFSRLVLNDPDSTESILLYVESLLNESEFPAAFAVMTAASVFERHLYKLCVAYNLPVPSERKDGNLNKYAHELRRAAVLNLSDQNLTLGIQQDRNFAAHGAFDMLGANSGKETLRKVRHLVAKHPIPANDD